ncbi:PAS domain S-box-containing protein [Nannocystis exedens]|uniref:histidine kinase n=1 Tax=Nannocystis exedens TaxID=54 RepID=A0A1I2GYV4_9BACT|nr:PAS domain S-box protein [Nannocystis exedens]PCC68873.1 Sensor protein EvgS precursor [Nannocystis exedens]SFF22448.1 PAS domain S-box-containing protein [Nannocystis exedens]
MFTELERVSPFLFSLLENSPDYVTMISPEGIIRFINRTHPRYAMIGLIGRSVFSYLAPESQEVARACFRRVVETGEPGFFEALARVTPGEPRRYATRVGPVQRNGRVVALTLIASDVTERVAMEQRLREQRDTLEFAAAATGLGLWHLDVRTRELVWDDEMIRIHGRGLAPTDYTGVLECIHPDDRARVDANVHGSLTSGTFQDIEYRVVRPDGGLVWVLARGKALRDEDGRVTRLLGGVLDISERKRNEEALRVSEERYRTSIAALEEGIVLQSRDGTIHTCNASAERLLGLTKDQMLGRTSLDPRWRTIHEDGSPFPGDTHPSSTTLASGEPQSGVIMGVHKPDGQLTWISVNSRPLYLAGPQQPSAVVTSFFDITARKHAEAENERLLRVERAARRRAVLLSETSKLLAASLDVIASLDEVVRHFVPEAADLAVVELLDEHGKFGPAHPVAIAGDDAELEARYHELSRRLGEGHGELLGLVRHGEVRFTVVEIDGETPVLPGVPKGERLAERLRYRSTVLVPLTARTERLGVLLLGARTRAFDADDLALAEELGLRIAQALDVARLYGEMQIALHKRDEFIAVASHELRTPLTPLMLQLGRLEQLCRGRSELATSVAAPKIHRVVRQTERLHRLIEELLDVSQITSGRFSLEPEALDLVALVRETIDGFAERLERAGCALRLEMPARVEGRWDRARLEQIVSNLLANAMKYGAGKPIDIGLTAKPDSVLLSVRDRGIGISPKDQARVFQRFERAVSERHYGGFGLGLWVTRHVAEAMGGSVSVESAPDVGSTFRVNLPRQAPTAAVAQPVAPPPP